MKLIFGGI